MPHDQLAVFGVCTRIFSLVAFGVGAVYAVTMPDMFESEALKDREGFHKKIGDANLVASGLSVALLGAVLLLSPIAFMLFGPEFQAGVVPPGADGRRRRHAIRRRRRIAPRRLRRRRPPSTMPRPAAS